MVEDASQWNSYRRHLLAIVPNHLAGDDAAPATLADLARPDKALLADWLDLEAQCEPGADLKAQAAYLIGRLSSSLASVLAAAHLSGLGLPRADAEVILVAPERYRWAIEDRSGEAVRCRIGFVGPLAGADGAAASLHLLFTTLLAPVVDRVSAVSRLSRGALWRLAADAIALALLTTARALEREQEGMALGRAILSTEGSPLRNSQTGYVHIEAQHPERPGETVAAEWFRARGGCCRYYTVPGGRYCTTCVLRKPEERDTLLRDYLASRALAAVG